MELSERAVFTYSKDDATRALVVLVTVGVLFALLHLITNIIAADIPQGPIDDLLDLDNEQALPTFFSSLQLFAIGALFALAYRRQNGGLRLRFLFFMLSIFFVFLSADEALAIHESITEYATYWKIDWLTIFAFQGDKGIWVTVYGILGVIFVLVLYRSFFLFWRHYRYAAVRMLWGAVVFGMGAVGLEVLSYLYLRGSNGVWYELGVILEELLEMWGGSLMLYGALLLLIQIQARKREPLQSIPQGAGKKVEQAVDDAP